MSVTALNLQSLLTVPRHQCAKNGIASEHQINLHFSRGWFRCKIQYVMLHLSLQNILKYLYDQAPAIRNLQIILPWVDLLCFSGDGNVFFSCLIRQVAHARVFTCAENNCLKYSSIRWMISISDWHVPVVQRAKYHRQDDVKAQNPCKHFGHKTKSAYCISWLETQQPSFVHWMTHSGTSLLSFWRIIQFPHGQWSGHGDSQRLEERAM